MGYRDKRRQRDEAQFIAATCKRMAAFAAQAGFPTVAYLLDIAELDVTQNLALIDDYPTIGKSA